MSEHAPQSGAALHAPLPEGYTSNPCAAEQAVLDLWRAERTFERLQASRAGAPPFVFWEGPPTANGRPGIHHVLARTLKDAVCRFHTMLGERVERKAGWDTHGLPVELEVEKALGISGKPAIEGLPLDPATGLSGVARFNDECRKSVWKYKDEWERLSARIGYWLDYEHPYVTYDPHYIDSVWYLLARMHEKGLIYRGKRVLPWCGRCGTGLSSHELGQPGVYKDVVDPSVIVRFVLVDGASSASTRESLLAWTTTPWTLPANFALAVHPQREYVRARVLSAKKNPLADAGEIVWIVRERAAAVLGTLGEDFEELGSRRGAELVGRKYGALFAPLQQQFESPGAWTPDPSRIHTVVGGTFVTTEDGTGIVHQAPYGADDWETARANQMPLPLSVGPDARFIGAVGAVGAGTFFKDADDALMDDLKSRHLLFRKSREPHTYPHCWRCNTPLLYFPAPAWFVRTTELKQRLLELNARIQWVPAEVGTSRFGEWLENNVDWNISRDRYWGTPLPFWVCDKCGAERAIESVSHLRRLSEKHAPKNPELNGLVVAAGSTEPFDPHKPWVDRARFACGCGGEFARTPAVLDCWFDSGAMPFAQFGWPHLPGSREKVRDQFPASYICEGLDQTRGWFYTLHAIGAFATTLEDARLPDGPTYRTCLVNGLVLDKDGVKMSKRLGNVVDPWKVIEQSGADAVRWYLIAGAAPWLPKRFDPKGLEDVRRGFFATLANSYQFFREYARIDRFDPQDAAIPPVAARNEIDRWLVSRTHSVVARVRARLADFDPTAAARALESFVVDELSNWYIRRNRRRFWKGETGADKLAAFATLHFALESVALALAPFAPFVSEMLWRRLSAGQGSVHAHAFPSADESEVASELEGSMELVQRIVVMGRALREKAGIKVRQPLRAMHVRSSDARALELLRTRLATEQVLDELNIKAWGSLAADDGRLCRLTGKANYRVLGKKLGARMKAAAVVIEQLDAAALASLRAGQAVPIRVDGEQLDLGPEDVLVQVETTADFAVETDGRFVVWLDTELDEALVGEGLAREVINRVNGLRKERGLAVEQRIALTLAPAGEVLARAIERHRALIAGETLARELLLVPSSALADDRGDVARWDLGAGHDLRASITAA